MKSPKKYLSKKIQLIIYSSKMWGGRGKTLKKKDWERKYFVFVYKHYKGDISKNKFLYKIICKLTINFTFSYQTNFISIKKIKKQR